MGRENQKISKNSNRTKSRSRGLRLHNLDYRPIRSIALGLAVFIFSFLVSSIFTPVSPSSAQEMTVRNRATDYYVTVSSSGDIDLDVESSPSGTLAIAPDVIKVKTNAPNGYQLYASATSSNLTSTEHDYIIPSVAGDHTSPTKLSINTWGLSTSSQDPSAPQNTSTWFKIPDDGLALIGETSTPDTSGANNTVYYGAYISSRLPSGSYNTTITYTAIADGLNASDYMQEFTLERCNALSAGDTITLADARDENTYSVTKLGDGHCWMTQNLRLDGGRTITSLDSNINGSLYLPESISSGASVDTAMQIISAKEGYDGNYYNWCAATASGDCSTITGEVTTSICPAGWRLPSNSGDYSFANLFSYYTSSPWNLATSNGVNADAVAGIQLEPLSFTKAGYYVADYGGQGIYGNYWSREAPSAGSAHRLSFVSSNGNFYLNTNYKYGGRSVRCVFMGNSYDETMQTFSADACAVLPLDASKILVDKRDGHQYSVARLRDGHCWMQGNLALNGNQTIVPADSNVAMGVTLPKNISSGSSVNTAMQIISAKEGYDGNYYNWCAATASGDCSTITGEVTTSICPAGWRLPSNSGDYSFANLFSYYTGSPWNLVTSNSTNANAVAGVHLAPLSFTEAGLYDSRYLNQGVYGYYWSHEAFSEDNAYNFRLYPGNNTFYPQYNNGRKAGGFSVRCLTN